MNSIEASPHNRTCCHSNIKNYCTSLSAVLNLSCLSDSGNATQLPFPPTCKWSKAQQPKNMHDVVIPIYIVSPFQWNIFLSFVGRTQMFGGHVIPSSFSFKKTTHTDSQSARPQRPGALAARWILLYPNPAEGIQMVCVMWVCIFEQHCTQMD